MRIVRDTQPARATQSSIERNGGDVPVTKGQACEMDTESAKRARGPSLATTFAAIKEAQAWAPALFQTPAEPKPASQAGDYKMGSDSGMSFGLA